MREKLQQRALEQSQQELVAQQAQLHHSTLLLELKNQLIDELETRLSNATNTMETAGMPEKDLRRMRILTDADWQHFLGRFERIAPGFIFRLKAAFPNLTLAETRLFLLVKLYFDSREISDATGISQESVWRGRHRLRKKLGLSEQVNLDEYIQSF
jgi:DNA-directed RNA polymerase specialized sigma24 family protein